MTRSDIIKKWAVYSLCALLLVVLQGLVLVQVRIWGIHPFLLPAIAVIPATLERSEGALIFAAFFGLLCDLLAPVAGLPCFYCLVFFAAAVCAWLLAARVVVAGLFCSLAAVAVALGLCGVLHLVVLSARGQADVSAALALLGGELVLSLPLTVLVHFPFRYIHRVTEVD